ncbi:MAG: hypothetical protein ACI8RD_009612 [Bacillariaceae sp.]|jgi:uncharacterized protein with ATP-grasp and redox domains
MEDGSQVVGGDDPSAGTGTLHSEMATRIAPIARSWIFDSNDINKTMVKSSSCPNTGEIVDFDVIRKEGFDDIMQSVANDEDKQIDVARSLIDSIEAVHALTPGWYVSIATCYCLIVSKILAFSSSKTFCQLHVT